MNPAFAIVKGIHQLSSLSTLGWAVMSAFSRGSDATASNDSFPEKLKNISLECESSIQSVIEFDIIPRLLSSQRLMTQVVSSDPDLDRLPTQFEIETLVGLCVSDEPLLGHAFVQQLRGQGMSQETIFLKLITPAARLLGEQFAADEVDFIVVTHGLIGLQAITHEIGYANQQGPLVSGEIKRVMISSAPGSEHMLGASIVSEFFRKEGWQVVLEVSPTARELVQAVQREWFDAIGLSVSIDAQLKDLADLVKNIKSASLNPRAVVMLGGPIFTVMDLQASDFGADGISTDAQKAVVLAMSLVPKD